VDRERAEDIYEAGREAVVEALLEAWAGVERVTGALEELGERIDELDRQIDRDSTNSSLAPSSDAPKFFVQALTGHHVEGHAGHGRPGLPPEFRSSWAFEG
jgi:hypothetical protein